MFNKVYAVIGSVLIILLGLQYADIKHLTKQRNNYESQIQTLGIEITKQNSAVNDLKEQQLEQLRQLTIAEAQAQQIRDQYDAAAKNLMAKKVPADCDGAIDWGKKQSRYIYKCWRVACKLSTHHA